MPQNRQNSNIHYIKQENGIPNKKTKRRKATYIKENKQTESIKEHNLYNL